MLGKLTVFNTFVITEKGATVCNIKKNFLRNCEKVVCVTEIIIK